MKIKIKNALISVSDKNDLESVLKVMKKYNINIISSGGTYKTIISKGFKCKEISKYTGFEEMLDGRVKTLHPKIHAGILHDRKNKKHLNEMKDNKFPPIDLIIVNFYPFQNYVRSKTSDTKIIENIDIGGPTLVRSAAKNFKNVLIITQKTDYKNLINELNKNKGYINQSFRELMASKAFSLTSYYDSMISHWFNNKTKVKFPERKTFFGKIFAKPQYGENPHQAAAIYINDFDDRDLKIKKLSGKNLSYNNYNDIFSCLDILGSLERKPSTVIIKHANPCGVSTNLSRVKSFKNAFKCDPVSAFGGVIGFNFKLTETTAKEINKYFFEVILCKGIDKRAEKILFLKKNLRVVDISKYKLNRTTDVRFFNRGFMIQDIDKEVFNEKKLKTVSKSKPTKKEIKEMKFAYNVCKFAKSNSIVLTKNFTTIGIGAGQPSRLDSCKIAVAKAKKFNKKALKNCSAASDAFFPFKDSISILARAKVKLIVQPGGSIRDKEVIKAADKEKLKMIFTGIRHFNH